jgi:hypothetical protein
MSRNVELMREIRLWTTNIIIPVGIVAFIVIKRNPAKWTSFKNSVKNKFKKAKDEVSK